MGEDETMAALEWIETAERFEDENPWLPLDELMNAFEKGDRR